MSKKYKKPKVKLPVAKVIPITNKKVVTEYTVDTTSLTPSITEITSPTKKPVPFVVFTPEVHQQMEYIVQQSPLEVGWMGLVTDLGNSIYLIDKIGIPEQEVTATETDIDQDALTQLALRFDDEGEDPSRMYAWFHSHVNMGVTPSAQDELQIEEFLPECPIFIRGIMNKKGALKVDVYDRDAGVAYNCVETAVNWPQLPQTTIDELDTTLKENVTKRVIQHTTTYAGYNRHSYKNVEPAEHIYNDDLPPMHLRNGHEPMNDDENDPFYWRD